MLFSRTGKKSNICCIRKPSTYLNNLHRQQIVCVLDTRNDNKTPYDFFLLYPRVSLYQIFEPLAGVTETACVLWLMSPLLKTSKSLNDNSLSSLVETN